ncbi:hypothetical protein T310_1052 [Rasamsonia emersonii CBS 393.64]|uniref:Uncharacterized protein n=1 Tax=Rasamsonia emersonii (strain ATCC 16479 / CBS 393.64 / IMI 116815) TaxID=1408163 RepID=A0A0F4Z482_RASE3|nr:hypothetical protein T310_1052 [Rasamsonia emersonii CBS 393.64]KKA24906.1 hypothetical protein T310_1052 [Rasamsonia emersonii CBS 393.64]
MRSVLKLFNLWQTVALVRVVLPRVILSIVDRPAEVLRNFWGGDLRSTVVDTVGGWSTSWISFPTSDKGCFFNWSVTFHSEPEFRLMHGIFQMDLPDKDQVKCTQYECMCTDTCTDTACYDNASAIVSDRQTYQSLTHSINQSISHVLWLSVRHGAESFALGQSIPT